MISILKKRYFSAVAIFAILLSVGALSLTDCSADIFVTNTGDYQDLEKTMDDRVGLRTDEGTVQVLCIKITDADNDCIAVNMVYGDYSESFTVPRSFTTTLSEVFEITWNIAWDVYGKMNNINGDAAKDSCYSVNDKGCLFDKTLKWREFQSKLLVSTLGTGDASGTVSEVTCCPVQTTDVGTTTTADAEGNISIFDMPISVKLTGADDKNSLLVVSVDSMWYSTTFDTQTEISVESITPEAVLSAVDTLVFYWSSIDVLVTESAISAVD